MAAMGWNAAATALGLAPSCLGFDDGAVSTQPTTLIAAMGRSYRGMLSRRRGPWPRWVGTQRQRCQAWPFMFGLRRWSRLNQPTTLIAAMGRS